LLPALPSAWKQGSVRGLRARGGYEVDIAWADGRLTGATVRSIAGHEVRIRYGEQTLQLKLQPGQSRRLSWPLSDQRP
jgi:alpha-L-fucosidase 2